MEYSTVSLTQEKSSGRHHKYSDVRSAPAMGFPVSRAKPAKKKAMPMRRPTSLNVGLVENVATAGVVKVK